MNRETWKSQASEVLFNWMGGDPLPSAVRRGLLNALANIGRSRPQATELSIEQGQLCEELGCGLEGLTIREAFNGIGFETDQGLFGICMRDGGIEVLLNGELVWMSYALKAAVEPEYPMPPPPTLAQDLAQVLNSHSAENAGDTPDFILAEFLVNVLAAWNRGARRRADWHAPPDGSPLPVEARTP